MKTKHVAVLTAIVVGLAVTLFAVEKQPGTAALKTISLKSNGATIAELKLLKGTEFEIASSEATHDKTTGRLTAKGGVTIQIKHAGGSPVTIKADEIEMTSDAQ